MATGVGCTGSPRDWVPLVEAMSDAAPVVASAAPTVIDLVHQLTPTPTPTPRPVGLVTSSRFFVLEVGKEQDLLPHLRNLDGDIPIAREVEWSTSNRALISLDADTGRIKGTSPGTAVVYARLKGAPSTSARATFTIEILDTTLVKQVRLNPDSLRLMVGESRKIVAEVLMANGEINGNVNWSSSDDTIAVVNRTTGEVSAVTPGRVTIVAAYAPEPRYKGLLEVTVAGPSPRPSP